MVLYGWQGQVNLIHYHFQYRSITLCWKVTFHSLGSVALAAKIKETRSRRKWNHQEQFDNASSISSSKVEDRRGMLQHPVKKYPQRPLKWERAKSTQHIKQNESIKTVSRTFSLCLHSVTWTSWIERERKRNGRNNKKKRKEESEWPESDIFFVLATGVIDVDTRAILVSCCQLPAAQYHHISSRERERETFSSRK